MAMLKIAGKLSAKSWHGYKIVTALNNYPEQFEGEQTWNELGKPTVTLAEYAKALGNVTDPTASVK